MAGSKTVGIIGLGIMGGAFAKNLAAGGFKVFGYEIDKVRAKAAERLGTVLMPDVETLAKAVPTIISSLPSPKALDAVAAQITAMKVPSERLPSKVWIETSTFDLADKLRFEAVLKKAGHVPLDCPISGTGAQAQNKDLVVYASGDAKAIASRKAVFLGFARAAHDLGVFGNGSRMKYVANLLVAVHNVVSAEAMVFGMKAGLDPQLIFDLISTGAGNSRIFELRAPMMVKQRYDATMTLKNWQKDLDIIGTYATQLGVPTPLFSAILPYYSAAMSMGLGGEDAAAICSILEKMAGVKRKKAGTPKGKKKST
jgi:3-hydroxyisobutyrate dehydrogenase-like beta-hydroxyacid dehydrogenase